MIQHIHGLPFAASQSSALPTGFGKASGASFAGVMAGAIFAQEAEGMGDAESSGRVLGMQGLTLVLSESMSPAPTKILPGEADEAQSEDARSVLEVAMPVLGAASLPNGWTADAIESGATDASVLAQGASDPADAAVDRTATQGRERLAAWSPAMLMLSASPADTSEAMVGMPEASRRLSSPLVPGSAAVAAEKRPMLVGEATEPAGEPAEALVTAAAEGKKLPPIQAMFAALARVGTDDPARTGRILPSESTPSEGKPVLTVASSGLPSPALSATSSATLTAESPLAAVTSGPGATPPPTSGVESVLASTTTRTPVPGEAVRVVMHVPAQFESPGWSQALGDKLVWMAGRQAQSAEMILNPPSLGAVEVRLNVSGGEASAQFFSANPAVREALESALPRLRELMGGVGIALGQASVSDQSQSRRDRAALSAQSGNALDGPGSGRLDLEVRPGDVRRVGLLDYFA